jgi:tetratricopeptide (TPR) repeat protein
VAAQPAADYKTMEPKAAVEYAASLVPQGRAVEAIEVYRYVADHAGDDVWAPLALYRMANLIANQGGNEKVRGALAVYEQLKADYPAHWTVTGGGVAAYVARYRYNLREHEQTIEELQQTLQANEANLNSGSWAIAIIQLARAHDALGQHAEAEEALTSRLTGCPLLLRNADYFGLLAKTQIANSKPAAALSTARAGYALCEFEEVAIQRAAELVRRSFIANGELAKGMQFLAAQESEDAPNPLRDVPLSEVPPEQKEAMLRLAAQDVPLQVLIYIYTGDTDIALARAAQHMFEADADHAVAALREVARAFKGADLNLVRGNQFINYARTGEGTNPLADTVPE